jgi:hypothetical protein
MGAPGGTPDSWMSGCEPSPLPPSSGGVRGVSELSDCRKVKYTWTTMYKPASDGFAANQDVLAFYWAPIMGHVCSVALISTITN